MKRYLDNQYVFLGFIAGTLVCVFYDVQVFRTLSALWNVLFQLF